MSNSIDKTKEGTWRAQVVLLRKQALEQAFVGAG